jgi:hypothetical protein
VSANEGAKWLAVWGVARRVAAPAIALLLGAAAMTLLLDAGTVHLPSVGSGSRFSSPPPESVVVTAPARTTHAHGHAAAPHVTHSAPQTAVTPTASAGSTAPPSTPVSAAPTAPVSHHPHPVVVHNRPTPKPAPHAAPRTGGPPVTPTATPHAAPKAPASHGQALGHLKAHPPGLALGHEEHPKLHALSHAHPHHGPPAHARALGHVHHGPPSTPPGHLHHTPPGLARKAETPRPRHVPPARGHGHETHESQGESHGEGHSHGRGHGH